MQVEYSLPQLINVCGTIMQICEDNKISHSDIEKMRVRLFAPRSDGAVAFDLGLPS